MRALACLALAAVAAGCLATPPPVAAPAEPVEGQGLEVIAFRVEANETGAARYGKFQLGWCYGCAAVEPVPLGWPPWQAEMLDRGLFWRANATFGWAGGEPVEAWMAADLLVASASMRCNRPNQTLEPGPYDCLRVERHKEVRGVPPLHLALESFDERIRGVRLTVAPVAGQADRLEAIRQAEGQWSTLIQAFHRAPDAEDVELSG